MIPTPDDTRRNDFSVILRASVVERFLPYPDVKREARCRLMRGQGAACEGALTTLARPFEIRLLTLPGPLR